MFVPREQTFFTSSFLLTPSVGPCAGAKVDRLGLGRGDPVVIRGSHRSVSKMLGWDPQEAHRVRAPCCLPGKKRGEGASISAESAAVK